MENPQDSDIKTYIEKKYLFLLLFLIILIWSFFIYKTYKRPEEFKINLLINLIGLTFDSIGVLLTLYTVPYFGAFLDCGELERKREDRLRRKHKTGLLLILIGFCFQALSISL
ncbi:hypothetical protein [Leptospira alexanderi]|uniref:hypothetical protein n=1 Tax=Leptospira alexanderi TaxID=100053 RepID=UPI0009911568|nr:hypothetical protein [Leptospira alexanderi]